MIQFTKLALCLLSYPGMEWMVRFELTVSTLATSRSSQLSYTHDGAGSR